VKKSTFISVNFNAIIFHAICSRGGGTNQQVVVQWFIYSLAVECRIAFAFALQELQEGVL